jgi:hypothetical protein
VPATAGAAPEAVDSPSSDTSVQEAPPVVHINVEDFPHKVGDIVTGRVLFANERGARVAIHGVKGVLGCVLDALIAFFMLHVPCGLQTRRLCVVYLRRALISFRKSIPRSYVLDSNLCPFGCQGGLCRVRTLHVGIYLRDCSGTFPRTAVRSTYVVQGR